MKSKREGFTLIELLVVIAIIALLLSILIPALNLAKERASKVVCQSRVRGLATAMNLYAHDYNGSLPRTTREEPVEHWVMYVHLSAIAAKQARELILDYDLPAISMFCSSWVYHTNTRHNDKAAAKDLEYFVRNEYNEEAHINQAVGMGYCYLVPRTWSQFQAPPTHEEAADSSRNAKVFPPDPYWGPIKLSDRLATRNPILVDQVVTSDPEQITDDVDSVNLSAGDGYILNPVWTNHESNNRLLYCSRAFADTHVDNIKGLDVNPQYMYYRPGGPADDDRCFWW